jgi:hypothetical protein
MLPIVKEIRIFNGLNDSFIHLIMEIRSVNYLPHFLLLLSPSRLSLNPAFSYLSKIPSHERVQSCQILHTFDLSRGRRSTFTTFTHTDRPLPFLLYAVHQMAAISNGNLRSRTVRKHF